MVLLIDLTGNGRTGHRTDRNCDVIVAGGVIGELGGARHVGYFGQVDCNRNDEAQ